MKTEKTLPAGDYWIGDLCYVTGEKGSELSHGEIFDPTLEDPQKWGVLETEKGVKFGILKIAYGDGEYLDNRCKKYSVDSGTIGIIAVSDIPEANKGHNGFCNPFEDLGHIHRFPEEFEVREFNGVMMFGKSDQKKQVVILTV